MLVPMSEILLEYRRQGAWLKVTAVDAATGDEAVAMGPASDPAAVKALAIQKLRQAQAVPKPDQTGWRV